MKKLTSIILILLIFPFQYSYSEVNKVGLICECLVDTKDKGKGFSKFRNYYYDSDGNISSFGVWIENNKVEEKFFCFEQK